MLATVFRSYFTIFASWTLALQPRREAWYRNVNFIVLLVDLFVIIPICYIASLLRVVDPRLTLGTSLSITLLIMLATSLMILAYSVFDVEEFKLLLAAHLMSKSSPEFKQQVQKFIALQAVVALSALINVSAVLACLGLNHALGPENNGEWVLLIVRNIGVVTWQTAFSYSSYRIYRNLVAQLSRLPANGEGVAHAQAVVNLLKRLAHTNTIKSVVAGALCAFSSTVFGATTTHFVARRCVILAAVVVAVPKYSYRPCLFNRNHVHGASPRTLVLEIKARLTTIDLVQLL